MRSDNPKRPQLSVLDRLIEGGSVRPTVADVRQSVRRDLEWLLNARRSWLPLPSAEHELPQSVLGYGLPDFTVMELSTEDGREWFCQEVEETIKRFEPRLARVRVWLKEAEMPLDRMLRLRIDAVLLVDPAPQPVAFDSELEPVNLSVSLKECA